MLGTNAQNDFRMLYTIAGGGVPLGICAMAVYPLTKKPGVRRFSFIGFSVGIAFGPVKNPGLIPFTYTSLSIFSGALDNVAYRTAIQMDGMLVVVCIGLLRAPAGGLCETALPVCGFNAELSVQSKTVTGWICFCFWGIDIMIAIVCMICFCFYDMPGP